MTGWRSAPLTHEHDLTRFASGNAALDQWLRREALRAHGAGISRTTVWIPPDQRAVTAYYAIAPTQVARIELPSRSLSAGYSRIPGYLIGRLALDQALHGQGLGTQLLLDALERIVTAADKAGGRLIVVDAIDAAAHRFYRHHGFRGIDASDRLFMKLATASSLLR